MSKSKNKNASEVRFLQGKIRKLEAEVKFLKRRQHIVDEFTEEEPEEVDAAQCPSCKSGILINYDYHRVIISKCEKCSFEKRQKKKG